MINVHVHVHCPFFDPNMQFNSIQSFTYVSAAIQSEAMSKALAKHGEEENDSDDEIQPPRKKVLPCERVAGRLEFLITDIGRKLA